MKKLSFRALFVILIVVASVSAQVFINQHGTMSNNPSADHQMEVDTLEAPHLQLDIEILKTLVEQGKQHLPVISSQSDL